RPNIPVDVEAYLGGELLVKLTYDRHRIEDTAVARLLEHFRVLLEGIVNNPDQPISRLPLLTAPERRQMLVEWNASGADYPSDLCFHALFERQVASAPNAAAVEFEGDSITYAELDQRANQVAHYLRKLGVGPEVAVGLC